MNEEKIQEFANLIFLCIQNATEDEENPFYVSLEEIQDENLGNEFALALGAYVPTMVLNYLTGEDKDVLGRCQDTVRLLFQKKEKREENL